MPDLEREHLQYRHVRLGRWAPQVKPDEVLAQPVNLNCASICCDLIY